MKLYGFKNKKHKKDVSTYVFLYYRFSQIVAIFFFYIFMYNSFYYLLVDINLSIFFDTLDCLFSNKKINTDNIINKGSTTFKLDKHGNFNVRHYGNYKFKKSDYYLRKENITRGYSNIVCWNKNTLSRTKYV